MAEVMTVAAEWPALRRELRDDAAVAVDEPSGRLHDTCTARLATARTARILLVMSQQLQSLTGADGDGGAAVLHLRAGVWPCSGLGPCSARSSPLPSRRSLVGTTSLRGLETGARSAPSPQAA